MKLGDVRRLDLAGEYLSILESYKDTVVGLFPALPRRAVDGWSISTVDALVLGYFLDHAPRDAFVFEIGTFVGVSTFFFASHERVSGVVSVDPNPPLSDGLTADSDSWEREVDLEALEGFKVLDVARSALKEFGCARKIEFREGVVGSSSTGVKRASVEDPKKVEVPVSPEDKTFVALVDGLHTREGVREDLSAIFSNNPEAVVFLDDCRYTWGPSVQAGVVDFIEGAENGYAFKLIGDLSPSLARSSLGILCSDSMSEKVGETLRELNKAFSERLDPLRLLEREADLIAGLNRANLELDKVRKTRDRLRDENKALEAILDRRTHKAAASAADAVLRVPGAKKLLSRKKP